MWILNNYTLVHAAGMTVESVSIPEFDALIKMPMPDEDLEEKAEKEVWQQAMAQMRAYRRSRGEEVESEVELYEDLEPLLVQEVELEGVKEKEKEGEDVIMAGLSSAASSWTCRLYIFC